MKSELQRLLALMLIVFRRLLRRRLRERMQLKLVLHDHRSLCPWRCVSKRPELRRRGCKGTRVNQRLSSRPLRCWTRRCESEIARLKQGCVRPRSESVRIPLGVFSASLSPLVEVVAV